MKKYFLFFICVMLLISFVWGDNSSNEISSIIDIGNYHRGRGDTGDIDNNLIIRELFSSDKVYFFNGFTFEDVKINIVEINETELSFVKQDRSPDQHYSIIGYSQGGLRALGYISALERKAESNPDYGSVDDIDAVITIAGINQGLPALDGGLLEFKKRVSRPVNVLYNGVRAAAGMFSLTDMFDNFVPRDLLFTSTFSNCLKIFMSFLPEEWQYIFNAWDSPNDPKWEQLHAMVPRSDYIREYVADVATYTTKVQTGKKFAFEWKNGRPVISLVPAYTYYGVKVPVSVFNSEVPIGFIAGTNSNTLSMLDENEAMAKRTIDRAVNIFGTAQGVHIAKCVFVWGLLTGSTAMAHDANKAKNLMKNFESELNTLKGSSQNDGLVALDAQYYPKTMHDKYAKTDRDVLRNPVLQKGTLGYAEVKENHKKIAEIPNAFEEAKRMIDEAAMIRIDQGKR